MSTLAATVEFGTSKIICTLARSDFNTNFSILGLGEKEYAGINNGKWVSPGSVSESLLGAIDACEHMASKRIRNVNVGVPSTFMDLYIVENTIEVPGSDGTILQENVEYLTQSSKRLELPENLEVVYAKPVYYTLDDGSYYLNPVNKKSRTLKGKIVVATADTDFIEDMVYVLDKLHIQIDEFIPECFAKATYLIPPVDRDLMAILVDVGYYATNISIIHADSVIHSRTVYVGGADLTGALSKGLGIEAEDAEKLKRRYSFGLYTEDMELKDYVKTTDGRLMQFFHGDIQNIIDERVEYLATIVYNEIIEADIALSNKSKMFLTGGGVGMMQGIISFMEKIIPLPIILCKTNVVNYLMPTYHTTLSLVSESFKISEHQDYYNEPTLMQKIQNIFASDK